MSFIFSAKNTCKVKNLINYIQIIFFCFGENEKKRLKKIISSKIYPLGKTLNNLNKSNAIKKI